MTSGYESKLNLEQKILRDEMKFPNKIKAGIQVLKAQFPENSQVEVQFGTSKYGKFIPGVNESTFRRVEEELGRSFTPSQEVLTVTSNGPIRKISGEDIHWIRKEVVQKSYDSDYGFQISASQKVEIPPPEKFQSKFSRVLTRSRYLLPSSIVDLTVVCCTDNQNQQYEVEIRTVDLDSTSGFVKDLTNMLRMIQDTTEIYTLSERNDLLKFLERKYLKIQQPRLLRYRDLVYGGIVGNSTTGYVLSFRPHGVRKFLVAHKQGLWLVFNQEVHLLARVDLAEFEGSVLDGTLVLTDLQRSFLVQDALWVGQQNVGKTPNYANRMILAQQTKNRIEAVLGDILPLVTQTTIALNTPDEFFRLIQSRWEERNLVDYRVKGLTFIPANMPATFPAQSGKRRTLTDQPDLVDWYPFEKLSLDLKVVQKMNGPELQVETGELFSGSQINPLDKVEINQPTGTVVEVALDSEGALNLVRIRNDRSTANTRFRALEIWDSMHDPITIEDLTGETHELLKKYQARERRELYQGMSGTLLVLNAGHGRDVTSWKKFDRIVLMESDPEQLEELYNRLDLFKLSQKTLVISANSERVLEYLPQISKFLGGSAGNLVMTQYVNLKWLQNMIPSLLSTGGRLGLMGLDGERVAQVFVPPLAGPDLTKFTLGPYHFSDFTGTHYNLTQNNQTQQLPVFRWDSLIVDLEAHGFQGFEIRVLDTEKLLPAGDLRFTRFWTSVTLTRVSAEHKLPEIHYVDQAEPVEVQPIPLLTPQQPTDLPYIYFPTLPGSLILVKPGEMVPKSGLSPLVIDIADPTQPLPYQKAPSMIRIGTLSENSLLHATLLSFDPVYQDNTNSDYRNRYVENLRRDLGLKLTSRDPDFPGKTYFQSVWGSKTQLKGIREFMNSSKPLGMDYLKYLTALFGFDFIVITANQKGFKKIYASKEDLPIIILLKSGEHFELIGSLISTQVASKMARFPEDLVGRDQWIQTYFEATDPLPQQI